MPWGAHGAWLTACWIRRECAGSSEDALVLARTVFVGVAGVYDIAHHYKFEATRGLEHVSPMAKTMGGHPHFASHSPLQHVRTGHAADSWRRLQATLLVHGVRRCCIVVGVAAAAVSGAAWRYLPRYVLLGGESRLHVSASRRNVLLDRPCFLAVFFMHPSGGGPNRARVLLGVPAPRVGGDGCSLPATAAGRLCAHRSGGVRDRARTGHTVWNRAS